MYNLLSVLTLFYDICMKIQCVRNNKSNKLIKKNTDAKFKL